MGTKYRNNCCSVAGELAIWEHDCVKFISDMVINFHLQSIIFNHFHQSFSFFHFRQSFSSIIIYPGGVCFFLTRIAYMNADIVTWM